MHGRMDTAKASTPGSAPLGRCAMQIACRAMDELLNGELFYSLREAKILIEQWRIHYNTPSRDIAVQYPAGHRSGHTVHWDIDRQRQKASSPWTKGQPCTNY